MCEIVNMNNGSKDFEICDIRILTKKYLFGVLSGVDLVEHKFRMMVATWIASLYRIPAKSLPNKRHCKMFCSDQFDLLARPFWWSL